MGHARVGAARQAARDRAGVRPPGQHRERHRAAPRARHVGARLLPAVREREGGLGEGLLEGGELGGRPPAPPKGSHPRPRTVDGALDGSMNPTRMRLLFGVAVLAAGLGCGPMPGASPRPPPPARLLEFDATAYSVTGTTASGMQTRRGIVAADPTVLPLGSRIRVHGAGAYSGVYTVTDTGPGVNGREIDIFIPDGAEAVRFGRRRVH